MVKAFPELRKTNGFVHFHELSSVEPRAHWWLKDRAGKIVDPTAHQFPEYCGFPILRYEEIDDSHDARKFEQARCHNCGDYYYLNPEIKLKGVMHNEDCNRAYVNYLNGVD
jgi:hypothetical protein